MGNIGHKTQEDRKGKHFYLSVSCVQCFPCLSFCVLCPMFPVSLFLFLVSNVTMSIFLCLVSNVSREKDRHGKHWTQDTER
jgi:hypothetical protein